MENKMDTYCSWESDGSDGPHQSQWLQTTLSELDKNTKTMLTLLEENDSLAHRGETYYPKRPEIITMIEEFNKSYRSLAEKYDQLYSASTPIANSGSSSPLLDSRKNQLFSNSSKALGSPVDSKSGTFDSLAESTVEDPEVFKPTEPGSVTPGNRDNQITDIDSSPNASGYIPMGSYASDNTWSELKRQVMNLMEENMQQQAELIRRNDEKRDAIKELRTQLEQLKKENSALQNFLECPKDAMKHNRSQTSTLRSLIRSKFLRGGDP